MWSLPLTAFLAFLAIASAVPAPSMPIDRTTLATTLATTVVTDGEELKEHEIKPFNTRRPITRPTRPTPRTLPTHPTRPTRPTPRTFPTHPTHPTHPQHPTFKPTRFTPRVIEEEVTTKPTPVTELPIRHRRSAQDPGWQLAEIPTTVEAVSTVLPTELPTDLPTTTLFDESRTTTADGFWAPCLNNGDLSSTAASTEASTTEGLLTTTEAMIRHARAAQEPGWQLTDMTTTEKVTDLPIESTTMFFDDTTTVPMCFFPNTHNDGADMGPGWEMEPMPFDDKSSTPFEDAPITSSGLPSEPTTTTFLPSTSDELIRHRRAAQVPGWQLAEKATTVEVPVTPISLTTTTKVFDTPIALTTTTKVFDTTVSNFTSNFTANFTTTTPIPEAIAFGNDLDALNPGWQLAETTSTIVVTTVMPNNTISSNVTTAPINASTVVFGNQMDESEGWNMDGGWAQEIKINDMPEVPETTTRRQMIPRVRLPEDMELPETTTNRVPIVHPHVTMPHIDLPRDEPMPKHDEMTGPGW